MSNWLLNTVSSFDLITQLSAYIQDLINGPAAHFGIPPNWSRRQIRGFLKDHGIKAWGLMLSPDAEILMFAVRKSQAWSTYQALEAEGIPVLYAPSEAYELPSRRVRPSGTRSRSGRKISSPNILERIFRLLDALDDRIP